MEHFRIGQRVMSLSKDKGPEIGTVKYLGPVKGYQGEWVGVDWDSGHGRHDGSVDGVHYFDSHSEKSGSFVRPQALTAGRTLLEAFVSKYRGESTVEDNDAMYLLSVRQKRVAIQFVGKEKIEEKQKHLEDLTSASLVYECVSTAGELHNVLPNLRELDLTGNLLADWHAVSQICNELPALRVLDLSRNRLNLRDDPSPVFAHLQTLVLNYCHINWRQVEILRDLLPVLEELHLCGNAIEVLELKQGDVYVDGFKCLRLLNLEDNSIESWEEVLKLSKLESLEQLYVGCNRLKKIFYPANFDGCGDGGCNFKPFISLRCLLLGGNSIQDWPSIDALNSFPNLKEVRLSDNPLTDLTVGGAARYLLVARLAKITILNGSEIKPRERRDSEIRYVHHVMNTMGKSEEERLQAHPRFLELKELHDVSEMQILNRKAAGFEKMADSLRAITLVCVASSVGEKPPSVKKLPLSTTIAKLKLVCESLYKVKASKQRLFLRDQDVPIPIPLNEDMETLGDICVSAEPTILMDEVAV